MKKRVLFVQRIFANYKQPLFDELNQIYSIVVAHGYLKTDIKQVTTDYSEKVKIISYSKNPTNVFINIFPLLNKVKPDILIHEFSIGIISLYFTFMLCKIKGIKFILWGHGYNLQKGFNPKKSIIDRIRLLLVNNSDATIFYANTQMELFSNYVTSKKLFVAPNTINTKKLSIIKNNLAIEGREKIKLRLGWNFKYNLIFIGRIVKEKYPECLISVFELLKNKYKDLIAIHFLGSGDFLNELKDQCLRRGLSKNFFFYGAIHDDITTGEMLFCSDLMIMPGYIGLSLVHSFCYECPVVSFNEGPYGPHHSPEIEFLVHGKTGFLAKTFDLEDMSNIIDNYLSDKDLQLTIKNNINYSILNICSLEKMVQGFCDAIEYSYPA